VAIINKYFVIIYFLMETLLLTTCYLLVYWLKTGNISPEESPYDLLFFVYIVVWLILSTYYRKYNYSRHQTFHQGSLQILNQSTFMLLFLALLCSLTSFHSVSRLFLLKIVYLPALVELFVGLTMKRKFWEKKSDSKVEIGYHQAEKISIIRILVSGLILATVIIGQRLMGYGYAPSSENFEHTLLILILSWMISSSITSKFMPHVGQNLYYKTAPYFKSNVIMILISSAAHYFGRMDSSSIPYELFITVVTFSGIELALAIVYFKFLDKITAPLSIESLSPFAQEGLMAVNSDSDSDSDSDDIEMLRQLESIKYEHGKELLDSIRAFFKANQFNPSRFRTFYHRNIVNIQLFRPSSQDCLLNYYLINDIRDINAYFGACYNAIIAHGYLIGLYTPQDHYSRNLEDKMPRLLFVVYFPLYYLLRRVLPKLPGTGKIYSVITGGKHKLISKAELWGRLAYAGFSVKLQSTLNERVLFIAQKSLTAAREEYPSYGPVIKLKRLGLNGEIIRVYKLRTMYPYSEFIQKEVYEQNSLDESGKLKNDFRRNGLGKILRKFWLDELPQLYNWIKGDIGLVGVRALSEHYLSLYPLDLQELRKQHKPGLLPPYYADLPKSFDEIIESERQYLNKKNEQPIKTDMIYLYKIFVNIVFRGARSG
jgi:lipopolysaccharide/colanic/teichoic acid biosynthesis glycosyltransferase